MTILETHDLTRCFGQQVAGGESVYGLPLDYAVLTGAIAILVAIGTRLYPRIVV